MIEVRIDINWMQEHQHNIMHSILMMNALRDAGIPVIGRIVFNGPARGILHQHRENTLDGDDWVVRWWNEVVEQTGVYPKGRVIARGSGYGYSWIRYEDPNDGIELPATAWSEEEDW